jgi:hypothetical protein
VEMHQRRSHWLAFSQAGANRKSDFRGHSGDRLPGWCERTWPQTT